MNESANKERVRSAFAAYNAGEIEAYVDHYADPVVVVDPNTGETTEVHRERSVAGNRAFREVFPDHTCEIKRLVAEGDMVMVRYVNRATHTGQTAESNRVYGEPTGKEVAWGMVSEYRLEDGHIAEVAVVGASLSLLRQLGTIAWPPLPANGPTEAG